MSLRLASPNDSARRSPLLWLRDFVVTVVGGLLLYATVLAILHNVSKAHWLIGAVATVFYALAVALGLSDLHGDWARRLPIHKGIGLVLLVAFTGIAVAASASFQLLRAGWAEYEPAPPLEIAYLTFNSYYLWVLVDLIPGLDAAKTLVLEAPIKPKNWVAGLPVVAFRAFVIFGILAGVKVWWSGKRTSANPPPKVSQGDA